MYLFTLESLGPSVKLFSGKELLLYYFVDSTFEAGFSFLVISIVCVDFPCLRRNKERELKYVPDSHADTRNYAATLIPEVFLDFLRMRDCGSCSPLCGSLIRRKIKKNL